MVQTRAVFRQREEGPRIVGRGRSSGRADKDCFEGNPFFVAAGRGDCYTRGEQSVLGKKGAGMKRHWSGQQGAILVLTAFLLPFIIAFTGMAVDFGSAYVRRSQLQNAADAAVLAGAYHLDDGKADDIVLQYLKTNLDPHFTKYSYEKGDAFPDKFETLNYHTDKQKDELDVTLRSSVEASFLRLFDINTIPVSVTATAKVSQEENNNFDDMFNYGLVASDIPDNPYNWYVDENWQVNNDRLKKDSAILFDNTGAIVNGNILTNGRIGFDGSNVNTLNGKIYASKDVLNGNAPPDFTRNGINKKFSPDVWGTINYVDWNGISVPSYLAFKDKDGNGFTEDGIRKDVNRPGLVNYVNRVDISRNANPGINELIENYRKMKPEERIENHVFYDDAGTSDLFFWTNSNGGYPGWTDYYTRWYRVIIAQKSVTVNLPKEPKGDEFAILISLNGDITIPNGNVFNGILYAPNGKILINGNGSTFNGSIIGKTIEINSSNQVINHKNYFAQNSSGSGSTGKKTVKLIK